MLMVLPLTWEKLSLQGGGECVFPRAHGDVLGGNISVSENHNELSNRHSNNND